MAGGAAFAAIAICASVLPGRADPGVTVSMEFARPIGDTYNERTTDGDAYPESLGVRALFARGDVAAWVDYRRNVYLTESRGAGSLTRYAGIEGGTGTTTPFLARESSFEARIERRTGTASLYAGLGAVRTWTNYHYPVLTALGAGLELRPRSAPGVRTFGSAYYYPSAAGTYATQGAPQVVLTPRFSILKLDGGVVLRGTRSRLYAVAGYGFEQRSGHALPSDVRFIRSDPYAALGIRL